MCDELVPIGQFSKMAGLSIKTLRFYHESGVLEPASVDSDSGYRYYSMEQVETARGIKVLRELEFPIREISAILAEADSDEGLVALLQTRREQMQKTLNEGRQRLALLDQIIAMEQQGAAQFEGAQFEVVEKTLEPQLIASIRHQGSYADSSRLFPRIGRSFGRHLAGKPLILCWDKEYKESDADFEVAFPVKKGGSKSGIQVYELAGGAACTLLHRGPYSEIHRSYRKLFGYISRKREAEVRSPTREVYLKGPGMIFKGKPQNYLTEIQVLLDSSSQ